MGDEAEEHAAEEDEAGLEKQPQESLPLESYLKSLQRSSSQVLPSQWPWIKKHPRFLKMTDLQCGIHPDHHSFLYPQLCCY